jgi:ketosteroid isomerase-like protein
VSAEAVARRYFDALARRDLDAAEACWQPGGVSVVPIGELAVPEQWRAYFEELFAAIPDSKHEVLEVIVEDDRVAVRWRLSGGFAGLPYQGIRATGHRIVQEGVDVLTVEEGLIRSNHAYWDDAATARQLGLMPPRGSRRERALLALFNTATRVRRR